jgi:hypothetical protein
VKVELLPPLKAAKPEYPAFVKIPTPPNNLSLTKLLNKGVVLEIAARLGRWKRPPDGAGLYDL